MYLYNFVFKKYYFKNNSHFTKHWYLINCIHVAFKIVYSKDAVNKATGIHAVSVEPDGFNLQYVHSHKKLNIICRVIATTLFKKIEGGEVPNWGIIEVLKTYIYKSETLL